MLGLPNIEGLAIAGAALAIVGLGLWGAVERDGRKDAEKALIEQQNQFIRDANQQWERVAQARNEFDEAVRDGMGKLRVLTETIATGSAEFRRLVDADPNSRTALTPGELAALRLLSQRRAGQQAGGRAVQPANPPSGLRPDLH